MISSVIVFRLVSCFAKKTKIYFINKFLYYKAIKSFDCLPSKIRPQNLENEFLYAPFSPSSVTDLKNVLTKAKDNKTSGITHKLYKTLPDNFLDFLSHICYKFCEAGKMPKSFTRLVIFPFYIYI